MDVNKFVKGFYESATKGSSLPLEGGREGGREGGALLKYLLCSSGSGIITKELNS